MLSTPIFLIFCLLLSFPLAMTYYTYGQASVPTQGLRQLPQDYSITTYPPAGVQAPQNSIMGINVDSILQTLGGVIGGGGLGATISKILGKKTEQEIKETKKEVAVAKQEVVATKQTTQKLSENQVKIAEVQEQHLNLTYDQMPQKGNEIVNKPVLKQDNVKGIKEEAIKTAAQS